MFDHEGAEIWRYGDIKIDLGELLDEAKRAESRERSFVSGSSAVDLDGDGKKEVLISLFGDGIRAFDFEGKPLWHQKDDSPDDKFEVLDFDGDGKKELIEFGATAKVRSLQSGLIQDFKTRSNGKNYLFRNESGEKPVLQFFRLYENSLELVDQNGGELLKMQAPLSRVKLEKPEVINDPTTVDATFTIYNESAGKPQSTWVRLKPDQPQSLAVIAHFVGKNRAVFYVHSESGELLYHELLPEEAETIEVLPAENGAETILVGGQKTVWRYTAK